MLTRPESVGPLTIGSPVPDSSLFFVQAYRRRQAGLEPSETIDCGADEDLAFRRGRTMAHRVAGLAFFRIDTSASGDQWTEVEVLSTVGEVPDVEAA